MDWNDRWSKQAMWTRGDERMVNQTKEAMIEKFIEQQLTRLGLDITQVKLCIQDTGITTTYWLEPNEQPHSSDPIHKLPSVAAQEDKDETHGTNN